MTAVIGRTQEIVDNFLTKHSLVLRAFAAESVKEQVLQDGEAWDQVLIRKTIYSYYWKNLNLFGHKQKDQGFQLFSYYWIGHAHNIYLQYATDFGILMCICYIILCAVAMSCLIRKYIRFNKIRELEGFFLMLVPLLFGMLEFAWGSGSVTILLLFICLDEALQNNKPT